MKMLSKTRARSQRRGAIMNMLGKSEHELRDIGISRYQLEVALNETDDPKIFEKIRARSQREMPF